MTLADILIPLAGSISNEKALKMREACDLLESRVDINQRGTNHTHDLISLLTDRVKELERDNLDRRLTKLERAVDVLDRQRVETLNLRVNGLEHTKDRHKRILEFIEYECVSPLEDRVSKLESATKNTGEGSTSQTGAVSHSQSGGGSDGTREPARSARIDDAGTTQDTPSPDFTVKPCPCGAPARIRQADDDWMISCTDIACDWCIGGGLYASKEDMLRAWNRRAPAETLRAVRLNTGSDGGIPGNGHTRMSELALKSAPVGAGSESPMISRAGTERNAGGSLPGSDPAFAVRNTGEGTSTHEGDVCSDRESAPAAPRNTPSPASSVPAPATGEVPEWVPSADEIVRASWTVYDPDRVHPPGGLAIQCAEAVRRLIAIRAPAAPVVDVSRLLIDYRDGTCATNEEDMTRALAAQGVRTKDGAP